MNVNDVDVENLPEMKISAETFEALPEINGEELPAIVNGSTWKRRIQRENGEYALVICRYRTQEIGGPITMEMLRPAVTGPMGNNSFKRMAR